jgi:RNA polymerase-interacting CarD/CdnL/TRCF family regulator
MLPVGNTVIYPCLGPCYIDRIFTETIDGKAVQFYHLVVLDESRGGVTVPVDKAQVIGIRGLLTPSQIPKLLRRLNAKAEVLGDWKQRAMANRKLLLSGSAFDLADIVSSLTYLKGTKTLSPAERQTLEKARALLIGELAEVMNESKTAAEETLDRALNE